MNAAARAARLATLAHAVRHAITLGTSAAVAAVLPDAAAAAHTVGGMAEIARAAAWGIPRERAARVAERAAHWAGPTPAGRLAEAVQAAMAARADALDDA